jgi:GntR family transcriptional regulator of vanillate catabolism
MSEDSQSQTLKAILGLRGLVIDGELKAGARVSETIIVERFGVSRTPARMALVKMHEEGLLEYTSSGYVVASFTEGDLFDAIEIRGTLEGMAVRFAAERGLSASALSVLDRCVEEMDEVVSLGAASMFEDFARLNDRFHELLVTASGSRMLSRSLESIKKLPFAAPNAFVHTAYSNGPGALEILKSGQRQHRTIVNLIRDRKGTRAQALMLEHSFSATAYLQSVIESHSTLDSIPGLSLIQRAGLSASLLKH